MPNKVELILTKDRVNVSVDILDFPYRLSRNSFTVSNDKMKVLGGTFSTQIELAKSKKNNQLFRGKSEFNSQSKFNMLNYYDAILYENGAEVMRGTFKLEEIRFDAYVGTFYDQDINWVDQLSSIRLNQLGYMNGQPTWLADFDGTQSFNVVNVLNNRQTDYICPTLIYNNTPITDYLELTSQDIWGIYETNPSPPPALTQITSGMNFPDDFRCQTGFFGSRLGLTFEDFPPALYYRNVVEKVFEEIGLAINCPLFNEDWFNALYMTYSGDGYVYNWKHIAKVASWIPATPIMGLDNIDDYIDVDPLDLQNVPLLPRLGGGAPIDNWITNPKAIMKMTQVIKHDDYTSPIWEDWITAHNKFNIPGQYICPVDGQYKIKVGSGYYSNVGTFRYEYDTPSSPGQIVWDGDSLILAYASQEPDSSSSVPQADRHYGWDDNVLVIMRKNQGDNFAYADTQQMLTDWMNGVNKDFIQNPSDVIAYVSPKRYQLFLDGDITNIKEAIGSPITDWQTDVVINGLIDHNIVSDLIPAFKSESYADIEITLDMQKNERIEIFWISLGDVQGNAATWLSAGQPFLTAVDETTSEQNIGDGIFVPDSEDQFFYIEELCGTEQLDLARNLPNITCKDFISSFINQFNLHFYIEGNTINFIPQKSYYTLESYDITPRVLDESWSATAIDNTKTWYVGYDNDSNDRLLLNLSSNCLDDVTSVGNYANVQVDNDNAYSENTLATQSIFSATKFYEGLVEAVDYQGAGMILDTTTDPGSGVTIYRGISLLNLASPLYLPMFIPSIQSQESFDELTVGQLNYNWNYTPRLLYHLGTVASYYGYSTDYQCLSDSPRADETFIRLPKHWFIPTVSAFDTENDNPYRTLRYDTTTGLYNTYFENLIDLYNQSDILTVKASLRNIDWINLKGSKKIKYRDNLYRLMSISDYDPLSNRPCTIKMMREI